MSSVKSLADWYEVLEGISLAGLVLFLTLSKGFISLGLISIWLVAIHTSVKESNWAFVSADRVTNADEFGASALLVGKSWSSRFAVSSSMHSFTSVHSTLSRRIASLDGSASRVSKSVEASDQVGENVSLSDGLKKSSLLYFGVGLVGNSHFGLSIVTDVSIVDNDLAEAFSDVVSVSGGSETDESDQQN